MVEKQVIGNATLYRGDCIEVLQALPGQFDALITDPPYSSGGMTRSDRTNQTTLAKYVQTGSAQGAEHNTDFTGDNRDSRSWGFWVSFWLSLVQERMKPGGYALCFTDWRQLPMLTDAFQAGGLVWRGLVPWDKTESSRAPHTGYFRHQCEYIVWGSNGALPVSAHGGPWPGLIRERVDHRQKLHMTGKPVHLMSELVKCVAPGGTILDPFMGSASTGVAALQNGHRFIGIEKSAHYFDIACKRMETAIRGDLLPAVHTQPELLTPT
jgi:site-specific DNA-methyltransferase (adenine-specific)